MSVVGRYVDVDGIRTYYEVAGEPDGPDRPTAVCIHTAGMDSTEWRFAQAGLAARGIRTVALDLPGHGKSLLPPGGPVEDLGWHAALVLAFIRAVGLVRPHLVGCSIGGCIALRIAVDHGDEVASVLAIAATDHNPTIPPFALELARADAGIPGWGARVAAYAAAATGEQCPEDRRAELAWRHRCGDPQVANADLRGWNGHDVRGRLAAAACPVTVLLGDEDFYIPADRAAALTTDLGAGNVVVVPGIGHYPMVEWAGFDDFAAACLREPGPAPVDKIDDQVSNTAEGARERAPAGARRGRAARAPGSPGSNDPRLRGSARE